MPSTAEPEPIIYRTEVLSILGALADIVVVLRDIQKSLEDDEEETDD